jgi:hypothetical protein
MADGRVRRSLVRVINDDNLDLYLLGTVALVFTVLGITGISDMRTTSSVVVALLALLAFSQIRSRRLIEEVRNERRGGATALFLREFPADLVQRRAQARDLLLIGESMSRTVHGMRADLPPILEAGGRIRILVLDPTDEPLIEAAERRRAHNLGPGKLAARVMTTLEDLTLIGEQTGGRLKVRVSSSILAAGFHCLDVASPRGVVYVQHYEFHQHREAAPIFTLEPSDGAWYQHFVAEAERLWDAGTDWPLSAAAAAARARRPAFSDRFGPELHKAIEETAELFVTGTARNSLISGDFELLKKKLAAGNRMRFLLVDPDSPAVETAADRYYAERSPDSVRERVRHSLRLLAELKTATGGDLSVRVMSHALPVTVIVTKAALFAQYFAYQNPGTPKFVLQPGDAGHDRFLDEAEAMWRNATPYEL